MFHKLNNMYTGPYTPLAGRGLAPDLETFGIHTMAPQGSMELPSKTSIAQRTEHRRRDPSDPRRLR